MHFHALTAFLAFSSASGLVLPNSGARAASTITWTPAGVESTTSAYPGALATTPDLSVPNTDQRLLDVSPPTPVTTLFAPVPALGVGGTKLTRWSLQEDAVLRRAGLVVARSGVPTARRRRSSPGA